MGFDRNGGAMESEVGMEAPASLTEFWCRRRTNLTALSLGGHGRGLAAGG